MTTHEVKVGPHPRRVRVTAAGTTIADSSHALLLTETGHDPVPYLPLEDVRTDLLVPTATRTHCPYKGDASYWSIRVDDGEIIDAAWGYPVPGEGAPNLAGYVAFYPDRVDVEVGPAV